MHFRSPFKHVTSLALAGLLAAPWLARPAVAQQFEIPEIEIEFAALEEQEDSKTPAPPTKIKGKAGLRVTTSIWLGILTEPISEDLRAQLDLPVGRGVVVRQIQPESPAAKAGVKVHDVLVEAAGKSLGKVDDLQAVLQGAGEKPLAIMLIRTGKKQTVEVQPTKRPQEFEVEVLPRKFTGEVGEEAAATLEKAMRTLQEQANREGKAWQFRAIGPGVVASPADKLIYFDTAKAEFPKGVSISITKDGAAPAKILLKRDGKTWEVDANRIDSVPEDLRPHVLQLLGRTGPNMTWHFNEQVPQEMRERMMKKGFAGGITTSSAGGTTTSSAVTLPLPPGVGGAGGLSTTIGVPALSGGLITTHRIEDTAGIKAELAKLREEVSQLRKEISGKTTEREAIQKLIQLLEESNKK